MKKKYFGFYVIALVMAFVMSACSSSSDDNVGGSDNPQSLTGVYTIDSYTLTFYDNSTFSATDNATGKNYTGSYTYNDPDLILSGVVATRAFSLEEGKIYSFNVARSDNNLVLTNKETGEVVTLNYVSAIPSSEGQLSPEKERAYIEATARSLETYFVADEWQVFTDVAKELQNVNADALESYADELIEKIFTGTSKYESSYYMYDRGEYNYNTGVYVNYYHLHTYIYNYNYYDRIFCVSKAKGQFVASYGGRWQKVGSDEGLKATYTDKYGAVWVLDISHSGSSGPIRIEKWKEYSDVIYGPSYIPTGNVIFGQPTLSTYNYDRDSELIDVPTQVTATLTRNGEVMSQVSVNISKFQDATDEHSQLSFLGQATGTVDVMIQPTGEAFNVHVDFDYANSANSSVNATIKRGKTELVNMIANATPQASATQQMDNVVNASAVVSVLNRLTVHMNVSEGKSIVDAYNDAKSRQYRYDEEIVRYCADIINNGVSAYITNGPSSTINQGVLRVSVKGKSEYYYGTRYKLYPTLNFADGSSYAFEDFFIESYFQSVIDYAEQLGRDFERMLKKKK
jgi:hypothetical protein